MTAPPDAPPTFSDEEEAAQKRFNIMAGVGVLVVLVLAFFALSGGSDEAAAAAPAAAVADTSAAPETSPETSPEASPAAVTSPPPPSSSRGFSGGGGRPAGGGAAPGPTRRAPAATPGASGAFTRERGVALGLSPRAVAALADSAAGRRGARGASSPAAPTSGPVTAGRATTMMSGPGSGTVLVTVPSGASLSVSGCEPSGGGTWCRATHAGFSGWVSQGDLVR